MKATSLFGGVQVFNILITIIRSKFIAILLGPSGMGIAGLLLSSSNLIGALTNFGLGTSAVRDVASAAGSGNEDRIATVITVLRRLVWITGCLGAILMILLSPILSRLTFGNSDYTFAFIWLSITLLFTQLSSGQLALLQGMRKLQYLAKASLSGSSIGLLVNIPLYYFFGLKGIVPAMICTSVISLSMSWYFARKIKIAKIKATKAIVIAEGKNMVKMGVILSISGLISLASSYIVRVYISSFGDVAQVGLYTAGFAIISTYVGLIFSAMGTDYYPRLAAVAYDNTLCKQTINQQAEIAILILAPIIMVFLVFIQWVVILLYSSKFIAINEMIHWAALGMIFKTASWAIGFILLAKGSAKLFFYNDLFSNIYLLALNLLGYKFWGLTGMGMSFLVGYFLHFIQMFLMGRILYQFSFDKSFIRVFSFQIVLAISCFLVVKFFNSPLTYILGGVLILVSTFFSYRELDKRIDIKQIISKFRKK